MAPLHLGAPETPTIFESGEGEQGIEEGGGDHEGKLSICDTAFLPLPLGAWGRFFRQKGTVLTYAL